MNQIEERVFTRRYSTRQRTAVNYIWHPYIPLGKVTVIQGNPGTGKTTLALAIAAFLSTGRPFPETDGEPMRGESIYQSAEDDPNDTITPRLFALGADCEKVSDISVPFNDIDKDYEIFENAIREVGAKMAVIDPWQAYIGRGNNINRASDVRRLMSGLAVLAAKTECAVVCIAHMNNLSRFVAEDSPQRTYPLPLDLPHQNLWVVHFLLALFFLLVIGKIYGYSGVFISEFICGIRIKSCRCSA